MPHRNPDSYPELNRNVEHALDEADAYSESTSNRMSHEEVFGKLRESIKDKNHERTLR